MIRLLSDTCRKFMTSTWSYPGGEKDSPVVDFGGIKLRNSPAYNSEATNIRRFISTPLTGPNLWWLDSQQPFLYFTHKPALCLCVCVCVCEATAEANLKQWVPVQWYYNIASRRRATWIWCLWFVVGGCSGRISTANHLNWLRWGWFLWFSAVCTTKYWDVTSNHLYKVFVHMFFSSSFIDCLTIWRHLAWVTDIIIKYMKEKKTQTALLLFFILQLPASNLSPDTDCHYQRPMYFIRVSRKMFSCTQTTQWPVTCTCFSAFYCQHSTLYSVNSWQRR
jgi:hypothetical protein